MWAGPGIVIGIIGRLGIWRVLLPERLRCRSCGLLVSLGLWR